MSTWHVSWDPLPRRHQLGARRPQQTVCGPQMGEVHAQVTQRVSGVQGTDLQLLPPEGNESRFVWGAHADFCRARTHWDLLKAAGRGRPGSPRVRTDKWQAHPCPCCLPLAFTGSLVTVAPREGGQQDPSSRPHSKVSSHSPQREGHLTGEDTEAGDRAGTRRTQSLRLGNSGESRSPALRD